jgi:aryl-alcohol dehydrogenase-like predicted oxidoreductase
MGLNVGSQKIGRNGMSHKIALGTVQFGLPYGVANAGGQPTMEQVREVIEAARQVGVDTIDTAINYGTSEAVLGKVGVSDFRVISKLPPCPDSERDIENWVHESLNSSLQRLGISSFYGILLHRPQDLNGPRGHLIYRALQTAVERGLIEKTGISVYRPEDLAEFLPRFEFGLIQAPLNVFDRRLHESGWLDRLNQAGIEVHVRSVFLQGLLLMDAEKRPAFFKPWQGVWDKWDRWLETSKVTPLDACLAFVRSIPGVSRIVAGVVDSAQLHELCADNALRIDDFPEFGVGPDDELINPAKWRLK